jgi:hypothetical protein
MVMVNVGHLSNTSTATHYGQLLGDNAVAIRPDLPGSPVARNAGKHIPRLVLTRNHCNGGCLDCMPFDNLNQVRHSLCNTVTRMLNGTKVNNQYPDSLVVGSYVLVRNPFEVIRTRVHEGLLAVQDQIGLTREQVNASHTTREGFDQWCRYSDRLFEQKDATSARRSATKGPSLLRRTVRKVQTLRKALRCPVALLWPSKRFRILDKAMQSTEDGSRRPYSEVKHSYKALPCYSEWLRYVMWYNNALQISAFQINRNRERILYYEDMQRAKRKTLYPILKELDLEVVNPNVRPFKENMHDALFYYTQKEAREAARLVLELASSRTWEVLRRYFEGESWFDEHRSSRDLGAL